MKKFSILWLTGSPSPYRTDFYKNLSVYCNVTILYERKTDSHRDKNWFKSDSKSVVTYFLETKNFLHNLLTIKKMFREDNFDFVFNCNYCSLYGLIITRMCLFYKKRLVFEADGGIPKYSGIIKKLITNEFNKTKYFLSSSQYTDLYFLAYGVDNQSISRYTFTSLTNNDIEKNKLMFNDKTIDILSVGQIIPRKGYDILIKAMSELPQFSCKIIGGQPTEELISLMSEYNVCNVEFIDFVNKEELKKYYSSAKIFVLPTREDIWGLVINEALSFGLPIIGSDNCVAAKHFVNLSNCGEIFENENYKDLRKKIKYLLSDNNKMVEYSDNAYEIIKKSTIEHMVDDHMRFFNKVTNI